MNDFVVICPAMLAAALLVRASLGPDPAHPARALTAMFSKARTYDLLPALYFVGWWST